MNGEQEGQEGLLYPPGPGSQLPRRCSSRFQNPTVIEVQATVIEGQKDNKLENYLDLCDVTCHDPNFSITLKRILKNSQNSMGL